MNTDDILTDDQVDVALAIVLDSADYATRRGRSQRVYDSHAALRRRLVEETRRADEAERRNLELEAEIPSLRSKAEFFDDAIAERNAAEGVCTKLADALNDEIARLPERPSLRGMGYAEGLDFARDALVEFAGVGASAPERGDSQTEHLIRLAPAPVCPTCGKNHPNWRNGVPCRDPFHSYARVVDGVAMHPGPVET